MTIDFSHFQAFTGISHEKVVEQDIHKEIADLLYTQYNGIMAHDVALRIYKSEGPVEFNKEEVDFLRKFAQNGTPIFMDSLEANIKDE